MRGKIRFKKEDVIFDMPLYTIFMVLGDAWYVLDKATRIAKRFSFERFTYLDVMEYAESIGEGL